MYVSDTTTCVSDVGTFQLGDFHVFDLLQFVVALSVFVQQPAVVLALHLVLVLQLVILLLQVVVLVLTQEIIMWSKFFFIHYTKHMPVQNWPLVWPLDKQFSRKL